MIPFNEAMADALTRHRLLLLRYEGGTVQALLDAYDGAYGPLKEELDALKTKLKAGEAVDLRKLNRLRTLTRELSDRIRGLRALASATLEERLREVAAAEAAFHAATATRLGGFTWGAVPDAQVEAAVTEPIGGGVWTDRLATDLVEAHDALQGVLGRVMAGGLSIPRAAQLLETSTGLVETYRNRFVAIVRTEVQRVANTVAMASYAANEDVVSGVQFLATLDSRTCLICAPLHGKVFELRNGKPVGLDRIPPLHPRCRCFLAPVTRSWEELGLGPKQQKLFTGEPSKEPTFNQWLQRQPVADQQEVLGLSRWKLWNAGTVSLEGFSDQGQVLNLGDLKSKYNQ